MKPFSVTQLIRIENFLRRLLLQFLGFNYLRLASIYFEDSPSTVKYSECMTVSKATFLSIPHVLTGQVRSHAFQERLLLDYFDVIVDSEPGIIFNSEHQIIKESSSWPGDRLLYAWPTLGKRIFARRTTYQDSLFMPSYGFYHWLIEDLPTFIQCADYFPKRPVLVNKNSPKFVFDFLETIPNEIIRTEKFFEAKNLASVTRGDDVGWPLKSDIEILRNYFKLDLKFPQGKRLYISRRSSSRSPANERKVEEALKLRGFEIVQTEKLDLKDAINLISTAEIIVGPHGAGLSGQIWMTPGSTCVDLTASSYWTEDIYRLSSVLGHEYIPFIYGRETQDEINVDKLIDLLKLNGF